MHRRIDDAIASIQQCFRESMIADLLNGPTGSHWPRGMVSTEPASLEVSRGGMHHGTT
jgi:hypothetical protein